MRSLKLLIACLCTSFVALASLPAKAQLNPDGTLGAEPSVVTPDIDSDGNPFNFIVGGTTRGENLFHSFSDFNINENEQVYFNSPAGIETILSRVTGSSLSEINGLLGTTGDSDAALILMNPNGIVFGEGATLNTQGAFTATTATGVRLGERGFFSAVDPKNDLLLSVNPSAFFFNELAGVSPEIRVEDVQNFEVAGNKTFSLVGEDITISRSKINAFGNKVELVAVGDAISTDVEENSEIVLHENANRGNILIEDDSSIDVRSRKGGSLSLVSGDTQILSSSLLSSSQHDNNELHSAEKDLTNSNFITIDATGTVKVSGVGAFIGSNTLKAAENNSDDIIIHANFIEIKEGAFIYSITEGDGKASNIIFEADADIVIEDSSIINSVQSKDSGQGGNILLSGENIYILANSLTETFALDESNSGDIYIKAVDAVEVSGTGEATPFILSAVGEGKGNSGDISVYSNRFKAIGDVFINTSTVEGNAGNILVESASEAYFGAERSPTVQSVLSSSVLGQSSGKSGNVEIKSPNVQVLNGFQISTSTIGEGGNITIEAFDSLLIDGFSTALELPVSSSVGSLVFGENSKGQAGNVYIRTGNLNVTNGGVVNSATGGDADAGVVRIEVTDTARFDGARSVLENLTIVSGVRSNSALASLGSGQGGKIELFANNLELTNGAQILAASVGKGDAGDILIDVAETVRLDGVDQIEGVAPSSISSDVLNSGTGQGGSVEIRANRLEITNGGDVSASVLGRGNAGDVMVGVSETVRVDGVSLIDGNSTSSISSTIEPGGIGDGGRVNITATNLEVTNGGSISTSVLGKGDAGVTEIAVIETVRVDGVNLFSGKSASNITSNLDSNTAGQGGSIEIVADRLEVTNGGNISTATFRQGDAGDISVSVSGDTLVSGFNLLNKTDIFPSIIGSSAEQGSTGSGGNIRTISDNLEISNNAKISTAAVEGDAGQINLEVSDQILIADDSDLSTLSSLGSGGQIVIRANGITLKNDGDIRTFVRNGEGTGGNIKIDARYAVALSDSDILSFSTNGRGGNIDLQQTLFFNQNSTSISELLESETLLDLDKNNRVDVNATGGIASGEITIADVAFVDNSLSELPDNLVDTEALIASACISHSDSADGTLVLRDRDRTPQTPIAPLLNTYSTNTVQPTSSAQPAAIQEPQALYQLADGRTVISHRCE